MLTFTPRLDDYSWADDSGSSRKILLRQPTLQFAQAKPSVTYRAGTQGIQSCPPVVHLPGEQVGASVTGHSGFQSVRRRQAQRFQPPLASRHN